MSDDGWWFSSCIYLFCSNNMVDVFHISRWFIQADDEIQKREPSGFTQHAYLSEAPFAGIPIPRLKVGLESDLVRTSFSQIRASPESSSHRSRNRHTCFDCIPIWILKIQSSILPERSIELQKLIQSADPWIVAMAAGVSANCSSNKAGYASFPCPSCIFDTFSPDTHFTA
jgi:hypothetical protein